MIVSFQEFWCCTWKAMEIPISTGSFFKTICPPSFGVKFTLCAGRLDAKRRSPESALPGGEQNQPDLRPPPTECLRDSFAREDSSAPCCINFFPPRRSRFPRKAFFSFFLVFLFLAMAANYSTCRRTSTRIPNSWRRPPALSAIGDAQSLADGHGCVLKVRQARNQL